MDLQKLIERFTADYLDYFVIKKKEHLDYINRHCPELYHDAYDHYELKDSLIKELFKNKPDRFEFNGYKFMKVASTTSTPGYYTLYLLGE